MIRNEHRPPPGPLPLAAVIFDWAGTVVDFGSCAPVIAFVEAFRQCGVEITAAQARGPMGMAKRAHIAAILETPEVARRWRDAHQRDAADADIDRIYEIFLASQAQVIGQHSDVIPGVLEAVADCRRRGLKIGSSTGYTRALMAIVVPQAQRQGFAPDVWLCADDIRAGRPAPWLIYENARRLGVFPSASIVKVDDTLVGIAAGLNAGVWTVGVAESGNLMGLTAAELHELDEAERTGRLEKIYDQFRDAGVHYIINTVADLPAALDDIAARLAHGERP